MKVLGVTGGIGSGKSTVVKRFVKLGVPAYVADREAKRLMVEDEELVAKIKSLMGEQAYVTNNDQRELNREYLSEIAFAKADTLKKLNALVHPAVRSDFESWKSQQDFSYVVYEAAILIESGGYQRTDYLLLVMLEQEERIRRVRERDKVTEKQVRDRMHHQYSPYKSMEYADILLKNENLAETHRLVDRIHDFLLNT